LTVTSWRVVREAFAARAFDGEGARAWGGRWNSAGRAVVYTSATTSLGLLEKVVHTEEGLPPIFVTIPVTFDADLVETVGLERLTDDWRSLPAPFSLKRIGDGWVDSRRSCILEVPSAIVPHESNFILNPEHPDFAFIEIGDPIDLDIDQRLG
jgi:RES domain-containing protein